MFIVRSELNNKMILCTDGDWHPQSMTGPGGWTPKTYKTRSGAERSRGTRPVIVEQLAP